MSIQITKARVTILLIIVLFAGNILILYSLLDETTYNPDTVNYNPTTVDDSQHFEGLDLFADRSNRAVFLMDSETGDVKMSWDIAEALNGDTVRRFNYGMIWDGGDLIYTDYRGRIDRITEDEEIVWEREFGHHDSAGSNGSILTYKRVDRYAEELDLEIQDDVVNRIDPKTGEVTGNISLYEILQDYDGINIKDRFEDNLLQGRSIENGVRSGGQYTTDSGSIKLFHGNAITTLNKNFSDQFSKNRILFSLRNLDLVILVDWNHTTITENNTVMIYDNGWETRNYTRVVKVNPQTNNIIEEYTADPRENFYSQFMGSAQELPNGNLLIANSMNDRAFEINSDGETVWRHNTSSDHGGIFRYTRISEICLEQIQNGTTKHSKLCS